MVVEISEFPLTIYYKPALYLLLKSSPNSILEYFLQQYRPTASCSSHHGHLTCSRHVCVGIWIEVRISDRVEGVHHMSGELFLLMQHSLFIETVWHCWLIFGWWPTASLCDVFFQNFFIINCSLVFICAVDYFSLIDAYTQKNDPPWLRFPSTHCCSLSD